MQEFKVAAKRATSDEEEVLEIPFGERVLTARRPTVGQLALFYDRAAMPPSASEPDNGPVAAVFGLLRGILGDGDVPYLRGLLSAGAIEFGTLFGGDDENESGLADAILAEWAGRPTEPSSDSSPSPAKTGRPSTGRTPGKGSTRSTSRSTAS